MFYHELNEADTCVLVCRNTVSTDHVKSSEDVAVVVTGLQIFGDIGKCGQVFWILSRAGDVPNLMLCDDIL